MTLSPLLALVLALLVLAGCGGRANEPQAQEDEKAAAAARAPSDGELEFVPAIQREGNRVVLPVTFPDGTSAELVYPPELEIAELGVFPYTSGSFAASTRPPVAVTLSRATS